MSTKPSNVDEKVGFLRWFRPGDSLPDLNDLGISNRVTKDGAVEWQTKTDAEAMYEIWEPILFFLEKREDRMYSAIFRGFNLLSRALMGFAVRNSYDPYFLNSPFPSALEQMIPTKFTLAPMWLQERLFRSAYTYFEPQLRHSPKV